MKCAVHNQSSKACSGEVTEVLLLPADSRDRASYPNHLSLCQYHNQLELMLWGIRKFFEVYSLLELPDQQTGGGEAWREVLEAESQDSRLYYSLAEELEFWMNHFAAENSSSGCHPRSQFDHLKDVAIDLGEARLTDKQLMAVCMVFYGGVKKKRAAQAMNITSQALADHIRAALKKIEDNIARN